MKYLKIRDLLQIDFFYLLISNWKIEIVIKTDLCFGLNELEDSGFIR